MANPSLTPGGDYDRIYSYAYVAEWHYRDAVASTDHNAEAFGPPPWTQRQGLIRQPANPYGPDYDPPSGYFAKPVIYLPVKRRKGEDKHPTLIISIKLVDERRAQNKHVKIWAGTSVEVEVVNVLAAKPSEATVTRTGKLDANLSCTIEIDPSTVKGWLPNEREKNPPASPLKARVNENLLDFRFKLKGVSDGGNPVVGQSQNRLFLYCRKTIVFLPGLFGSELRLTLGDGRVLGYPAFWRSNWVIPHLDQHAGILECDENGVPLFSFPTLSLLMLHPLAYPAGFEVINPFTSCHAARLKILPHVPPAFRLYLLIIYPYDWRADLTDAAARLNQYLLDYQTKKLGPAPDTDDQIAIMGHSTGGVVMRRAMGKILDGDCIDPAVKTNNHPKAEDLISLAFYLSVPFNGAPKALSVLMTGLPEPMESPGYLDRMIPFLLPETLFAISLAMPIVYHLATTSDYGYRPASSPTRPPRSSKDREGDKAAFVNDALDAGLMPRPWFVKATVTDFNLRRQLAEGADQWHQLIRELAVQTNGRSLIQATNNSWASTEWFTNEIQRRGLQYQYDARRLGGWNATLAARANAFHEKSKHAITGPWKERSAIFFGITDDTLLSSYDTLRQVNLSKGKDIIHRGGVLGVLHDKGVTVADVASVSRPHFSKADWRSQDGRAHFFGGTETFSQWNVKGDQVTQTPWTLAWVTQELGGDGTVPSDSQLAEAPNISKLIPIADYGKSPKHMDTTKADHVWESLVLAMHRGFAAVPDGSGDNSAANQKSAALNQLKQPLENDPRFVKDP